MESTPPNPKAVELFRKAMVLLDQQSAIPAERLLREAITLEPEIGMLYTALTRALNLQHRYPEAVESGLRAVELDPGDPDGFFNLTRSLHLNQQYEESLEPAIRCIELDPNNADSYVTAAASLYELVESERCLQFCNAGLSRSATHPGCQHFRALALARLGRTEEAHNAIRVFLDQDPHDCYGWTAAGWVHFWEGDHPGAIRYLSEALRLHPQEEWAHEGMGLSLLALNRRDQARRHLEEARRLCPHIPRVNRALAEMNNDPQQPTDASGSRKPTE